MPTVKLQGSTLFSTATNSRIEVERNSNPWPHIKKYFNFSSKKGSNLYFQCQKCLPARKIISCSEKSRSGLKSNIQHVHSFCSNSFKACLAEGSKSSSKKLHLEDIEPNQEPGSSSKSSKLTQRWLKWLPDINAVGLRKTATNHLSRLLENNDVESNSSETEKASDNEAEGLLGALYEDARKERSMDLLFKTFLQTKPNKGPLTVDAFPHKSFRDLFLRFNTQIPSSAAVEGMFFMGKDVLKPKRCKMSDQHFEMLVFLRGSLK